MTESKPIPRSLYAGLFAVALATLMFEILLTRIFSATTWYHYAFMAVSVAMFGMTAGAISVYLRPQRFTVERATSQLASSSMLFAVAIPLCFLAHLCIPFEEPTSLVAVYSAALTYVVVAIPFYFSGVAVCIALTRFPHRVSSLYAADLLGAGVGCIVLLYTLRLTDGPTAVLVVSALAALGALAFAVASHRAVKVAGGGALALVLAACAIGNARLAEQGESLIRFTWVKGGRELPLAYERWNSFSRITVQLYGGGVPSEPFGWGMSKKCDHHQKILQLGLQIDGSAGTVITNFDGDTSKVAYLECDVTNMAHYLRPDAKVLVVGTGGGRDLLSALVFDQREVVGVEMNQDILATVNDKFGDFSGHLDQHPKIRLVNDEARSFIARSDEKFDILQISLIDTWAATTAGAFVLAENALYTLEGWRIFLDHLSDNGVITVSRWSGVKLPREVYRTVSLAAAALRDRGVEHPERHIAVVNSDIVGNVIVGRSPLSDGDMDVLSAQATRLGFEVLLARGQSDDAVMAALARGEEVRELPNGLRLDLSPPSDDRPFFFNMLRISDLLDPSIRNAKLVDANLKAVLTLGVLLVIVAVLTLLCIVLPLALSTGLKEVAGATPLFVFFGSIGLGFMLIELSQMHRLILLLGHPTYGLSVVLFALLLSSGVGSFVSQRIRDIRRGGVRLLLVLLAVLALFGIVTPSLALAIEPWPTPVRIAVAVAMLFPLGLLLGMAFPLGLRVAVGRSQRLTPWLWGINGAASVLASVLATGIALTFSISTAYWAGACCYVVALLAFLVAAVPGGRATAEATP